MTVHHPEDDTIAPVVMHKLTEPDREKQLNWNGREERESGDIKCGRLEPENKQQNKMNKDK